MAAKPPTHDKQLHFFPGTHQLIWLVAGRAPMVAEAWGGEEPVPGATYDVMKPRMTTAGRYVIHSYAPYRTNSWPMSRIRWGTRLKVDARGILLFETGLTNRPWLPVSDRIPTITLEQVKSEYFSLFGDSHAYDTNRDGIPDEWVFNDFGPMAVRYFVDKNRNKRLDGNETLSGEMIHTTPNNEGEVAQGQAVQLFPSHGCIHVSPFDRDRLRAAGAFALGVDLVVHKYGETVATEMK